MPEGWHQRPTGDRSLSLRCCTSAALSRITNAILRDERAVLRVSTLVPVTMHLGEVSRSVLVIVGREGIRGFAPLQLSDKEQAALKRSAGGGKAPHCNAGVFWLAEAERTMGLANRSTITLGCAVAMLTAAPVAGREPCTDPPARRTRSLPLRPVAGKPQQSITPIQIRNDR